jgi:hypothetical protein
MNRQKEKIQQLLADPYYRITEEGKVFTLRTKTGKISKDGIWREIVRIVEDGYREIYYDRTHILVHRVVFQKFNGDLDDELTINHKDGDTSNNHKDNLEQITQQKNNLHSYRSLGKKPVKGNATITQEIALKIRVDRSNGDKYAVLMERYSLSKSTISYIINNKTWSAKEEI